MLNSCSSERGQSRRHAPAVADSARQNRNNRALTAWVAGPGRSIFRALPQVKLLCFAMKGRSERPAFTRNRCFAFYSPWHNDTVAKEPVIPTGGFSPSGGTLRYPVRAESDPAFVLRPEDHELSTPNFQSRISRTENKSFFSRFPKHFCTFADDTLHQQTYIHPIRTVIN